MQNITRGGGALCDVEDIQMAKKRHRRWCSCVVLMLWESVADLGFVRRKQSQRGQKGRSSMPERLKDREQNRTDFI